MNGLESVSHVYVSLVFFETWDGKKYHCVIPVPTK